MAKKSSKFKKVFCACVRVCVYTYAIIILKWHWYFTGLLFLLRTHAHRIFVTTLCHHHHHIQCTYIFISMECCVRKWLNIFNVWTFIFCFFFTFWFLELNFFLVSCSFKWKSFTSNTITVQFELRIEFFLSFRRSSKVWNIIYKKEKKIKGRKQFKVDSEKHLWAR